MSKGRGWHGDSEGHNDAGKQAHESRFETTLRRLKERLPIVGGGR